MELLDIDNYQIQEESQYNEYVEDSKKETIKIEQNTNAVADIDTSLYLKKIPQEIYIGKITIPEFD